VSAFPLEDEVLTWAKKLLHLARLTKTIAFQYALLNADS